MKIGFLLAGFLGIVSAQAHLVIINRTSVHIHDEQTGAEIAKTSSFPTVESIYGGALGPDGDIYVAGNNLGLGSVLKFDGRTSAALGAFVPQNGSGIRSPLGLAFGTDGDLFVSSSDFTPPSGYISRFDGRTGASEGTFVPVEAGLTGPIGITFGPDGNLYIADGTGIVKFNGQTGASMGRLYPTSGAPSDPPRGLAVDADGTVYFVNSNVNRLESNGEATVLVNGATAGLELATRIAIAPDGDLFVGEGRSLEVKRFTRTGQSKGVFARAAAEGNIWMAGLLFSGPRMKIAANANSGVTVTWPETYGRFSAQTRAEASGSAQWQPVTGVRADGGWKFEAPANGSAVFRLVRE